jgi:hypothetical protein
MIDISEETIERYRADGAVVVRGAIGPEWLDRLAGAI